VPVAESLLGPPPPLVWTGLLAPREANIGGGCCLSLFGLGMSGQPLRLASILRRLGSERYMEVRLFELEDAPFQA